MTFRNSRLSVIIISAVFCLNILFTMMPERDQFNASRMQEKRELAVYDDRNENDTCIFFIHGAGGRADQWKNQIEFLRKNYAVIAFDLIGHGNSPKPATDYGFQQIADEVENIFYQYKKQQNVVIAHSYGVALALHLALQNDEIQKLILIGAATPMPLEKFGLWNLPPFMLEILRPLFSQDFAKKAFHSETDPDLVKKERGISDQNPMYMMKQLIKGMAEIPAMDLSKIHIPVLIIQGAADGLTPIDGANELCEQLKSSKLVIVEKASHLVMIEQPNEVNQLIEQFIK